MNNPSTQASLRRTPRWAPAAVGVIAGALVLAVVAFVSLTEQRRHRDAVVASTTARAAQLRAELEQSIDAYTFVLHSLVGFATASGDDVDADEFQAFVDRQVALGELLPRALQLAPNAVVTHISPLEGNEAALGHDLLADPDRAPAVLRSIETGEAVVAGPVELLQGGTALIVRHPVFSEASPRDDGFWGLAIAVIDLEPVLADAGWYSLEADGYEGALRGANGRGAEGEVFLGDSALFGGSALKSEVAFGTSSWQVAVQPAGGLESVVWPGARGALAAGVALAIAAGLLAARSIAGRRRELGLAHDLASLIEAVPTGIVVVDEGAHVVDWNEAATRLTGVPREQAIGRRFSADDLCDGQPEQTCHVMDALVHHALLGGDTASQTVAVTHRDGSRHDLAVLASRAMGSDGVRVIVVLHDRSAEVEVEEVRAQNDAMARTARLKDEFLAGMSHELRTPLNGVIGLSSILARQTFGELNDKQAQYVGQIEESGRHLLSLINDVLDLAKLEAEGLQLERTEVAVSSIVGEAVALVNTAYANGAELCVDVQDDPVIDVDPRRVIQVLVNLLDNAAKFTEAGDQVTVTVARRAGDVTFEVRDTGIGIPQDKLGVLFEPFQQVDGRLQRRHGGTGLGLALSRRLMEQHEGTISVTSQAGQGSTFVAALPASVVVADRAQVLDPVAADTVPPKGAVVVLAEDHDLNRRMLSDFLEAAGAVVWAVADGQAAIDAVREHRPDVVLMDVQMPGMDGLTATRALKAEPTTAEIPVVALTALAMRGDERRCLDAGCDAYLTKPFDPAEVVALVDSYVKVPS